MNDAKAGEIPALPESSPSAPAPTEATPVSPGVGTLFRGTRADHKNVFAEPGPAPVMPEPEANVFAAESREEPSQPRTRKPLIPLWYLFAGDVLLVALALGIYFRRTGPLSAGEMCICIGAILGGAILSVAAVLLRSED